MASRRRVLVVATEALGDDRVEEVRAGRPAGEVEVLVVAPVIEESAVKLTAGDLDDAREQARRRLASIVGELRRSGFEADGRLGDTEPMLAAEDALRSFPADDVLVIEPPEEVRDPDEGEPEIGIGSYVPGFARGSLAALVIGIGGTIVAAFLFAAGPGTATAAGAAQGLIALAAALINLGHAIGLTLFESVRYRGVFQSFFRNVTLVYTPIAVLANLLIALLA